MTPGEAAAVALVGGLLAVERVPLGQFGVGQPIVAGPLVGWLLGDAVMGLLVGGTLQLLYAGSLPVGATVPPDESTAAVVGAAAGAAGLAAVGDAGAHPGSAAITVYPLAVLCALAAGEVGRLLDLWVRRANIWLAHRADAAAAEGRDAEVGRLAIVSLAGWLAAGALAAGLLAPVAAWTVALAAPRLGGGAAAGVLRLLAFAVAVVAVASALVAMRARGRVALFAGALALGSAVAIAASSLRS